MKHKKKTKISKTKTTIKAAEPKKTAAKTTKVAAKQVETKKKPNISPQAVRNLEDLVALHPTASVNVLKAMTTDGEVKQLLDEFIEHGCGDSPIEICFKENS